MKESNNVAAGDGNCYGDSVRVSNTRIISVMTNIIIIIAFEF